VRIKKANLKRLASLTALGAGVLGAATGTAEANSIVYSGILDKHIGFSPGSQSRTWMAGPNGARGELHAYSSVACGGSMPGSCFLVSHARLSGHAGKHGTTFHFREGPFITLPAFPQGARFGTPSTSGNLGSVAFGISRHHLETNVNSTDRYLLFRFTGGNLPDALYGWAQLEAAQNTDGLAVTLVDWAYDTSGAQIPAGDTGTTPEPSTFALTGLAALALGAKGLRAWRSARRHA
jgi:hypothetical protein